MSSAIPSPSGQAPGGADESASGAPACPLDELQFLLLRQAVIRRRPIRRAARVARSSAWTILVIGLAGWPVAMLVPSLTGFFVVAGISFVGVMEYIGSGRMWRGERSAPGFLARNQLLFVLVIIAYCVYQMATFSPDAMYSSPETREMLAQAAGDLQQAIEAALPLFYYAVYGLVMLLSAVCQGGLALYYVTRRRYVDLFNRETPAWIVRIMAEVEQ